ncbi:MAG: gliding motility-associated C-terminal domain-containing protein [Crocinitomicaceae bacterium]|nr:gliding motility-associated C-terminal domain-containing protein [Crocinitomicaceae bacterium]
MRVSIFIVMLLFFFKAEASHIMGGSITYECNGTGNYIFQLVFYRDCHGAQVNTNNQTLRIWNHPTLSTISVAYISTEDISPVGVEVPGGPSCFNCVSPNGNIGVGSIEKITYRSAPINISGVPPAQGWVVTFDDFSRNGGITNLQNPLNYGITLTAKIFNVNYQINTCHDSSPQFKQSPHFIGCVGKPFKLNLNPVDPDLDSIAVEFDKPLNSLNNTAYSEGVNPTAIPYVTGFDYTSPTPSSGGSIAASLDAQTGELSFLSDQVGQFGVKIKVTSFRNGFRISEVVHEMQLIVTNCNGSNNAPTVAPPFAGSFQTTVTAGSVVNFNLTSTDVENLQDGSPQSNAISSSGLMFGPNPTVNTGCLIVPCPTVSAQPAIGIQGATLSFNWQTDCAHLLDANGNELDAVPYQFVFRVQDNYCPIPQVIYETVTVNVVNPGVIQAPPISCIQGNGSDFTINWTPVADPNGTFVEYRIQTVQNGVIATIPAIGASSYTHVGVTQDLDYFITVVSGCNGQAYRNSDTISNIYLDISNLNPGIAVLDWNNPTNPPLSTMGAYYYIYQEHPTGVWKLVDSIPYGTTHYEQIIDICGSFLNYQIVLNNTPCNFTSQINGAMFTDQTPPDIPSIVNVTIDTLTNETTINWTMPPQPDVGGYIVYKQDPQTGFLIELDTIYGKLDTTYTYLEPYTSGAVTYTVAAFDTCPSPTGDPFNLSARDPNFHTTIYLKHTLDICSGTVSLKWSPYGGWPVTSYEVYRKTASGGTWQLVNTTSNTSYSFIGQNLEQYYFAIKANKGDGVLSFSNVDSFVVKRTPQPAFSYLRYATVKSSNDAVELEYIYDQQAVITKIELQRLKKGVFETIETVETPSSPHVFVDEHVYVNENSYTYRVVYYDSCGNKGYTSNSAKSILLQTQIDNANLISYLNWTPYEDFDGSILWYYVYRQIDGIYDPTPIATLSAGALSYEDNLYNITTEGKVCYRVEAVEGSNLFNNPASSVSNQSCVLVEPLIFVPNAFYPDGVNTLFLPVLRNYDVENYRLTVFNRWGQVAFQTSDPYEGWNGLIHNTGKKCETGTYIYVIEMYNGYGEQIMTRGHVTLLR